MLKQSFSLVRHAFKQDKTNKWNLIISLVLQLSSIGVLFWLNSIYGDLYQAIQDYNINKIWLSIGLFSLGAGIIVVIEGYLGYMLNKLAFSIRNGLTIHFSALYERIADIANVEQRVQEDIRNFGQYSVDFWFAILKAVIKLPLFVGVIITLTQWWIGFVIVLAVVVATIITKLVSKKLAFLQSEQETNEAVFRKSFLGTMYHKFHPIKEQFTKINQQMKILSFVQSGFGQTFVLLPFMILMPLYLSKAITMGAFFQSVNALDKVIASLTVLIDNRQLIVNISTCLNRMRVLEA